MALRGQKPKPTFLKLLEGNPGKRPLNKREPILLGTLDEPPEWMNDHQKDIWHYAVEHAAPGMLKRLDLAALAVFVVASSLHREACQKVHSLGLIVKSPVKGDPIQNPYLPIINRQAEIMLRAAAELGFTPSSRTRVTVDPNGEEENPFEKFTRRA